MFVRGFKTKCENIAVQIRSELNLKIIDPLPFKVLAQHLDIRLLMPEDIIGLSERSLMSLQEDKNSWSAVTISYNGIYIIIYNPAHSKGRQSSDVMHEISHIMLGHKPSQIILLPDTQIVLREYNPDLEDEANWLAGCLLLPRETLLFIKRNAMDDDQAISKYCVSGDLFKFRINKTGINNQLSASRKF
jgi:Zn-dependent peptidase ImmA (M78 family)